MKPILRAAVAFCALLLAINMTASTRRSHTPREKAYYAAADVINFVRPGFVITINSAQIASDGTITAVYSLADPEGLPLDAAGITTPGATRVSFIAAVLANDQEQYVAYTTRTATGTVIASTQQAGADAGGTSTLLAPGQYNYTFHTKAPTGFDPSATHTIGIYGSRDLSVFNLGTNFASATFNFVPSGAAVTHVRDVIKTASCNGCHDQLSAHGGSRRGMEMCVLCHTPQTLDPNTGVTMDAKVFFHKIHMGENLPSVLAGTPFVAAKNQFGTFDYSNVAYPGEPGDPRRCETCHSQSTKAAQATAYLTKPSRAACGACHDNVDFATGKNHVAGPQFDDKQCSTCHAPQGEMDFDASIKGAHVSPISSSLITSVAVNITGVQNGTAGNAPVVSFNVKDNKGNVLPITSLEDISFTMAGPTTDYGYTSFGSDVTTTGYVNEDASGATCDAGANCTYTFQHKVPAKATGTYAIGVESERLETIYPGTTIEQTIESGTPNQVFYFSTDGSAVQDRRTVVATSNCNQCHIDLQVHGARRNNTQYCAMCHNPSTTDSSVRASATVAADAALPAQSVNFDLMVHRIHYGSNLQASNHSYIVVGHGGSHNDFSGVLFPALSPGGEATDTRNCAVCHVNNSQLNLPAGLNAVVDPQGLITPNQPVASACMGCHVTTATAVHAQTNTTSLGEACAVCHASGATYAVDKVHAQY